MTFKEKYIGDRSFYRQLTRLAFPLVVQQGLTNLVSLLDNVMVGALGTCSMSAVSIVNQLIFIFNIAVFGGLAGASIFGTQFFGMGDWKGMRDTFRFKMLFAFAISFVSIGILAVYGDELVYLFLTSESNLPEDVALTMQEAGRYLRIALFGLLPFAVVQAYAGTLRETSETASPMRAGILAILVNLVFNYLLIYGKFGFPEWGVAGAAVATVLSRFAEIVYVVTATHRKHRVYRFIEGAYRSMHVPALLVRKIIRTGTPLLLNEVLWALGTIFINRNYSTRGITAIAATNIASTAWNLFCVIMLAMGSVVAIMVGQRLGAGDREGAIDVDHKILFVTVVSHIIMGLLIMVLAPFVSLLYNVEPEVQRLATQCMRISGFFLPMVSAIHVIYFSIRSGGKTVVTFLFDSVYTCCVPALLSYLLCRLTSLSILPVYFIVQIADAVKLCIGIPLFRSGFWADCVVRDVAETPSPGNEEPQG